MNKLQMGMHTEPLMNVAVVFRRGGTVWSEQSEIQIPINTRWKLTWWGPSTVHLHYVHGARSKINSTWATLRMISFRENCAMLQEHGIGQSTLLWILAWYKWFYHYFYDWDAHVSSFPLLESESERCFLTSQELTLVSFLIIIILT